MSNISLEFNLKDGTKFILSNTVVDLTEEQALLIYEIQLRKQYGKPLTIDHDKIINEFIKSQHPHLVISKGNKSLEVDMEAFEVDLLRNFFQTVLLQYGIDMSLTFDQLLARYNMFNLIPESKKADLANKIFNENVPEAIEEPSANEG